MEYLNAVDLERHIRQVLGSFEYLLDGDGAQSTRASYLAFINTI
jgi:hypothetical protein